MNSSQWNNDGSAPPATKFPQTASQSGRHQYAQTSSCNMESSVYATPSLLQTATDDGGAGESLYGVSSEHRHRPLPPPVPKKYNRAMSFDATYAPQIYAIYGYHNHDGWNHSYGPWIPKPSAPLTRVNSSATVAGPSANRSDCATYITPPGVAAETDTDRYELNDLPKFYKPQPITYNCDANSYNGWHRRSLPVRVRTEGFDHNYLHSQRVIHDAMLIPSASNAPSYTCQPPPYEPDMYSANGLLYAPQVAPIDLCNNSSSIYCSMPASGSSEESSNANRPKESKLRLWLVTCIVVIMVAVLIAMGLAVYSQVKTQATGNHYYVREYRSSFHITQGPVFGFDGLLLNPRSKEHQLLASRIKNAVSLVNGNWQSLHVRESRSSFHITQGPVFGFDGLLLNPRSKEHQLLASRIKNAVSFVNDNWQSLHVREYWSSFHITQGPVFGFDGLLLNPRSKEHQLLASRIKNAVSFVNGNWQSLHVREYWSSFHITQGPVFGFDGLLLNPRSKEHQLLASRIKNAVSFVSGNWQSLHVREYWSSFHITQGPVFGFDGLLLNPRSKEHRLLASRINNAVSFVNDNWQSLHVREYWSSFHITQGPLFGFDGLLLNPRSKEHQLLASRIKNAVSLVNGNWQSLHVREYWSSFHITQGPVFGFDGLLLNPRSKEHRLLASRINNAVSFVNDNWQSLHVREYWSSFHITQGPVFGFDGLLLNPRSKEHQLLASRIKNAVSLVNGNWQSHTCGSTGVVSTSPKDQCSGLTVSF